MKTFVENGITHLDLHGVRHHEVDELVLDFVLRNQELIPLYKKLASIEIPKPIENFDYEIPEYKPRRKN